MYQLQLLDRAVRDLSELDKPVAARVVERLRWLAENLDQIRPLPLTGNLGGLYKLRIGDYRVIYEILKNEDTVIVHAIGHRRDVYR